MAGDGLAGGGPRRFRYYRLAGVGGPRQRYSDDQLDQLAAHCRAPGGRETICVFGNLASGLDAARLQKKLGVEQA